MKLFNPNEYDPVDIMGIPLSKPGSVYMGIDDFVIPNTNKLIVRGIAYEDGGTNAFVSVHALDDWKMEVLLDQRFNNQDDAENAYNLLVDLAVLMTQQKEDKE